MRIANIQFQISMINWLPTPFRTDLAETARQNIAIVLVRPQYAGNIGSVSRAMKNMGLSRLILVSPAQDHLSEEARMMATSARNILEKAESLLHPGRGLEGVSMDRRDVSAQGKKPRPLYFAAGNLPGDPHACPVDSRGHSLRPRG